MAEVVRLYDSSGTNIIDSVAGDYEDSFCLETFKDLCESHMNAEPKGTKGFIIARVQTLDPKQPDKVFYSYYNAFHLNKILFQTQVYLGKKLIHRLHVLNPLTNTDIIGHVQYFLVKPKIPTQSAPVEAPKPEIVVEQPPVQAPTQSTKSKKKVKPVNTNLSISTSVSKPKDMPVSASVLESESGAISWTISAPAAVMLTDEDIMEVSTKQVPTVNGPRRLTVVVPKGSVSPMIHSAPVGKIPDSLIDASKITSTGKDYGNSKPVVTVGKLDGNKVPVQMGQITRFSKPVQNEDSEKIFSGASKTRKRIYSLANVRSATGEASYQEWLESIKEEKEKGKEDEQDYDNVKLSHDKHLDEAPKLEENTYDAILFATDADFLEKSKIRGIFRTNAISQEDAALFEMPEVKVRSEANSDGSPVRIMIEEPVLCDLCYPGQAELAGMPKWKRFLHKYKCHAFVLLILAVLFVVIYLSLRRAATGNSL